MEKKNNANVKKIVIAVCVAVVLVAAVFLTKFFIDSKNGNGNDIGVDNTPTLDTTETTEPEPRPDYSGFFARYSE